MHKLFLSMHYLLKRRIALFAVAAVMLCVALLIVITSLFSGFIDAFHAHWRRQYGHVLLIPLRQMHGYEELARQLEQLDSVVSATPVIETGALLYLGRGDVRGVQLVGTTRAQLRNDQTFREGLLRQNSTPQPPGFELSPEDRKKARKWLGRKLRRPVKDSEMPVGAILGIGIVGTPDELTDEYDETAIIAQLRERQEGIVITTGRAAQGEDDAIPGKIQKPCWIVDAVQTGAHLSDTLNVYLPFDYVRDLTGTADQDGNVSCPARLQIMGREGVSTDTVIRQATQAWQQFGRETMAWPDERISQVRIFESTQLQRVQRLMAEVRKQLAIMQVIMGLICAVVALLVFVILFMMVKQKKRDMGIIRAVGASRRGVAGVFLVYGGCIGILGAMTGLALGVWATRNIGMIDTLMANLLGFKIWKSGVYMFREIPNVVEWSAVGWILAAGVASAVLGALLPAWRAGRLPPVESLRYE